MRVSLAARKAVAARANDETTPIASQIFERVDSLASFR